MEETPRASDLQIQVEQVNLALRQLKHTQESMSGLESRLGEMTRECAGILDRWAQNDERHATAVVELHSRLSEWNDIERRLLNESTTRIHQFERSLTHEWQAIRQSHEEPLRQIEAQTTRVTEACLTAVDQALKGFDRAEARLGTLEQDLQREMGTLMREVREAVAELRLGAPPLGARQPWSLDNVVRLHNELRDGSGPSGGGRAALALAEVVDSDTVSATSATREAAQTSFLAAEEPAGTVRTGRWWLVAATVVVLVSAFGLYLQDQLRTGLREAAARAEAAERGAEDTRARAAREIAEAQRRADQRLREAQQAAKSAQMMAMIASASDLRRFDLVAGDGAGSAQVLWSRSQGVALTASGIPAPPAGQAYQVWLLTPTQATSVGLMPVDDAGRATFVVDSPASLPRPVVRAAITREPAGGSEAPTGPAALSIRPAAPSTPVP